MINRKEYKNNSKYFRACDLYRIKADPRQTRKRNNGKEPIRLLYEIFVYKYHSM